MIEALRGLGYSTATALADIVDNSVSAGARNVDLRFVWNGVYSHITIQDDGRGMDEAELDRAMRLGHQSPLEERAGTDLGRFGLGLKTASFSQCRRLTVGSRRSDTVPCLRWDLDVLASSGDDAWPLLEGPADGSSRLLAPLLTVPRGTIVLWENLDRIVTPAFSEQNFLDVIDVVEHHLAMVFHRYLDGPHPRLRIAINDRLVSPWDPFLVGHPATWSSPTVSLQPGIEVKCHVLPHKIGWTGSSRTWPVDRTAGLRNRDSMSTGTNGSSWQGAGSGSAGDDRGPRRRRIGSPGSGSTSRTQPMRTGRSTSGSQPQGRPSLSAGI